MTNLTQSIGSVNPVGPVRPPVRPNPLHLSPAEHAILAGLCEALGMPPAVVVDPWDVEADPADWPEDTDAWTWTISDDDPADLDPEPTFEPTDADRRWWAEVSEHINRRRSLCPIDGAREPELLPSGRWA